jgi:transcriptional regulator with XRE-family HTH domain
MITNLARARRRRARADIGKNIRFARLMLDLHQAELAEKLEITQQKLSLIERGHASIPSELLPELAAHLSVTPNYIIGLETQ